MDDVPISGCAHGRAPVAMSRSDVHLAFFCVVIMPCLFWSTLVFAACLAAGWTSGPELSVSVFVLTSAFLTFVTRALRLRI